MLLWHSVDQREESGESLLHVSTRGAPVCQEHTAPEKGLKPQMDEAYMSLRVIRGLSSLPWVPESYGRGRLEEGGGRFVLCKIHSLCWVLLG